MEVKEITISDKMKRVHDNGLRIYPKFNMQFKFAVVVEDERNVIYKANKTIGEYKHTSKTVNDAIIKTLEHIYTKL
jgi:hypothetical protein